MNVSISNYDEILYYFDNLHGRALVLQKLAEEVDEISEIVVISRWQLCEARFDEEKTLLTLHSEWIILSSLIK